MSEEPTRHAVAEPPEAIRAPAAGPRYTKGARTKERAIDAAEELFARSGFSAVSLRDLASHAGLTHAGLLHHFPGGKDEILGKILERRDAADIVTWRLGENDDNKLAVIVGIIERNAQTPDVVALYAKLSNEATDADHPAHQYFSDRYARLRAFLAGQFEQTLPADSAIDPVRAATHLIALMDGLQTQWLLDPAAVDMAGQVRDFLASYGIEATPTPDET